MFFDIITRMVDKGETVAALENHNPTQMPGVGGLFSGGIVLAGIDP